LASNHNSNGSSRAGARRRGWTVAATTAVAAAIFIPLFTHHPALAIHTATVERGPIRSLISTNGKVEPIQNFEAHAPIGTTIKRLLVKEGDHVRKGQLLLQLDDAGIRSEAARAQAQLTAAQTDQSQITTGGTHEETLTLDAQLIKARSDRDAAQRTLDSFRRLQQQGAASPGEVRQAEETLQRAQADVTFLQQKQHDRYAPAEIAKAGAQSTAAQAAYSAAENTLSKSEVRAPFAGIVYSLPVKQGAYVQPGDLLLQEADLSHVLVRVFVDEPDVGRLMPGQRTEITWDAVPGRTWIGAVNTVPAAVKLRGARNIGEATCTVDNQDLKLLPNVNVNAAIITAEHTNVLTLQRDAIRIDDSKPYVYQVVDGHLKRQDVTIALQNLTQVEIASGLPANAVVALNSEGSKPLYDGAPVRVVP
jgi:HlyD family secretion protein